VPLLQRTRHLPHDLAQVGHRLLTLPGGRRRRLPLTALLRRVGTGLLGALTATEVFQDQLKDGGGDIVNVSSVAGRTARAGNGVYAATKWGMNGWSEALRQELLPDIRVTLLEPGVVATELPAHITHAATRQGVQQLYDKAQVSADDIAEIIAFVLGRPRHLAVNEVLVRPAGQL
jgi:NADP-dependent 3-hydroxy acid dehydrogenase YdfG